MVRVGGGWDTLEHYLLRHDPKQASQFLLYELTLHLHVLAFSGERTVLDMCARNTTFCNSTMDNEHMAKPEFQDRF